MIRFGVVLIFLLTFLKFSSQTNLDEINAEFKKFDDNAKNAERAMTWVLDDFSEKLKTSQIKELVSLAGGALQAVQELKKVYRPTIDELNSCDDLKLKNSTSFVQFNFFHFAYVDVNDYKGKLERHLAVIREEFERNKTTDEEKVKEFEETVNASLVS